MVWGTGGERRLHLTSERCVPRGLHALVLQGSKINALMHLRTKGQNASQSNRNQPGRVCLVDHAAQVIVYGVRVGGIVIDVELVPALKFDDVDMNNGADVIISRQKCVCRTRGVVSQWVWQDCIFRWTTHLNPAGTDCILMKKCPHNPFPSSIVKFDGELLNCQHKIRVETVFFRIYVK
jgi:hypothetical protein